MLLEVKRGFPWVAIVASLVLGLWLFASGFLSVRTELPTITNCSSNASDKSNVVGGGCPVKPTFQKAVLIVVDALREDFYFASKSGEERRPGNDLARLRQLVQDAGPAALAARFTADMPTITISRLKAWLTGCLPTFLDIGQSFSAVSLGEDNLLSQLAAHGRRTVFMGDDTWMQLAPAGVFTHSHPYPSFNVMDMHTVDDGVWKHLQHYLHAPSTWDVLIGHYLGVDHAGHAHGVGSAAMEAKVTQMDQQLVQVAEAMVADAGPGGAYEDTMLLVMSDHGQTLGGDHGGSSADEVNTLLMAFNLRAWWQLRHATSSEPSTAASKEVIRSVVDKPAEPASDGSAQRRAATELVLSDATTVAESGSMLLSNQSFSTILAPAAAEANTRPSPTGTTATVTEPVLDTPPSLRPAPPRAAPTVTISQLDFAATFAMLMGVPVPYSNVGSVDPSLWDTLAAPGRSVAAGTRHADGGLYLHALLSTCKQVQRYLDHYALVSSLPSEHLHASRQLFDRALSHASLLTDSDAHSSCNVHVQPAEEDTGSDINSGLRVTEYDQTVGNCTNVTAIEEAVRACRAFLDSAASLARRRFTGCNLPRMAGGCIFLLLTVAQVLWVLIEQLPGTSGDSANAHNAGDRPLLHDRQAGQTGMQQAVPMPDPRPDALITHRQLREAEAAQYSYLRISALPGLVHSKLALAMQPHVLVPLAVCVFQSCSLFGLDWMMSEGRVQCASAAACLAAMGGTAMWLALTRAKHGPSLSSTARSAEGQSPTNTPSAEARTLATMTTAKGQPRALQSSGLADMFCACATACMGVASMLFLVEWGLMDRASTDPHDKAAQSTTLEDLLGTPASTGPDAGHMPAQAGEGPGGGTANSSPAALAVLPDAWELCTTTLPLLLLPWLVWGGHALLMRTKTHISTWVMEHSHARETTTDNATGRSTSQSSTGSGALAKPAAAATQPTSVKHAAAEAQQQAWRPTGRMPVWLLCTVFAQFACCTLWWLLQLLGSEYHSATPHQAIQHMVLLVGLPITTHRPGLPHTDLNETPIRMFSSNGATTDPAIIELIALVVTASLGPFAVLAVHRRVRQRQKQHSPLCLSRQSVFATNLRRLALVSSGVVIPLLGMAVYARFWDDRPVMIALSDLLFCDHKTGADNSNQEQGSESIVAMQQRFCLQAPSGKAVLELLQLVLAVPYRLLLPRCVYLLCALGLGHLPLAGLASKLWQGHQAAVPSFWLAALVWPPVTLLLGRRGPVCMALTAIAVTSCLNLTSLLARCKHRTATRRSLFMHEVAAAGLFATSSHSASVAKPAAQPALDQATAGVIHTEEGNSNGATTCDGQASAAIEAAASDQSRCIQQAVDSAMTMAIPACMGGALTLHAISSALFFATGHFCEFTGLQYASPFIGFDDMQWWISPVLLSLNTFGAMFVSALLLALLPQLAFSAALHGQPALGSYAGDQVTRGPHTTQNKEQTHVHGKHSCDAADRSRCTTCGDDGAPDTYTRMMNTANSATKSALSKLKVVTLVTVVAARCWTSCMLMVCSTVLHGHILVWAIIAPRVVFELFFQVITVCAVLLCCAG